MQKDLDKNIPDEPTKFEIRSNQYIREGNYQEANKQALIESGIYDNSKINQDLVFKFSFSFNKK